MNFNWLGGLSEAKPNKTTIHPEGSSPEGILHLYQGFINNNSERQDPSLRSG